MKVLVDLFQKVLTDSVLFPFDRIGFQTGEENVVYGAMLAIAMYEDIFTVGDFGDDIIFFVAPSGSGQAYSRSIGVFKPQFSFVVKLGVFGDDEAGFMFEQFFDDSVEDKAFLGIREECMSRIHDVRGFVFPSSSSSIGGVAVHPLVW